MKEAFKIAFDDYAYIPLHQQALAWGVSKKVKLTQRADNSVLLYWATQGVAAARIRGGQPRRGTIRSARSDAADPGCLRRSRPEPRTVRCSPSSSAARSRRSAFSSRSALIAFAMFRFAGDPVNQIVSIDTPAAEREAGAPLARARRPGSGAVRAAISAAPRRAISASPTSSASRSRRSSPSACRRPWSSRSAPPLFALVFGILMGVYSALRRDSSSPRCSRPSRWSASRCRPS